MKSRGFTLIELLVVIAIIGLLATLGVVSLDSAMKKARDARRLSDISQIQKALEIYKDTYGQYPGNTDDDYGGWDIGNKTYTPFITDLQTSGIMPKVPMDSIGTNMVNAYFYYRYPAGTGGCDTSRGAFYVLVLRNLETRSSMSPDSPGWACSGRDWSTENYEGHYPEYIVGAFEN